jgi:hypothetical protein
MVEANLFMVDEDNKMQFQYYGDLIEVKGCKHEFYFDLGIANLKQITGIEFKNLKKGI